MRSDAENLLCCLVEFESDVSNGGFAQYFHNKGGDEVEAVSASLVKIGCLSIAGTLATACKVAELSPDEQKNNRRFLFLSEKLNSVDDTFYKQREELYTKLQAYLEKYPSPKVPESE